MASMSETGTAILKHVTDILDIAAASPPPKRTGLDGRKGLARRTVLSLIDDVLRLDDATEGADWSRTDIARLKEKALRALDALNAAD